MDSLFIINLVLSLAVLIICSEIARRWKRRRMLSLEFFMVGSNHLLSFVFFNYWFFYGSELALVLAAVSSALLASFLSESVVRMLYSPRLPLNWILGAYVFVPVVHLMTADMQLTLFHLMLVSALVITCSLALLAIAGRTGMRKYGAIGILTGLMAIRYIYSFLTGEKLQLLWTIMNVLIVVMYYGFLRMSYSRPRNFIADYNAKKDGK